MKLSDTSRARAAWNRMGRVYDNLIHWLYERGDRTRAQRYASGLAQLLTKLGPEKRSIFAAECRSLVSEAEGNLQNAIKHREKEISLIRRLHRLARNTEGRDFAFRQYTHADLADRFAVLAMLHKENGDLNEAIDTLEKSKAYCRRHGIVFDEEPLLRDYQDESRGIEIVESNGHIAASRGTKRPPTTSASTAVHKLERQMGDVPMRDYQAQPA